MSVQVVRLFQSKADWDPTKHPRHPAGAPDSQGGHFAEKPDAANEDDASTVKPTQRNAQALLNRLWRQEKSDLAKEKDPRRREQLFNAYKLAEYVLLDAKGGTARWKNKELRIGKDKRILSAIEYDLGVVHENAIVVDLLASFNRGEGTRWIKTLEDKAQKNPGLREIQLEAMLPAVEFYRKVGFVGGEKPNKHMLFDMRKPLLQAAAKAAELDVDEPVGILAINARVLAALEAEGLDVLKAFDPAKHPRHPVGAPDSQGGRFAPKTMSGQELRDKHADALAGLAQRVYDDWDEEDVDTYAGGGVCHLIADEFVRYLDSVGVEAATVSSDYEQHVYTVARLRDGVHLVDVPYGIYETGGGFSWKKRPGITFSAQDIVVRRIDADPDEFGQYIERAFDPAKHPRHPAGAPASVGGRFAPKDGAAGVISAAEFEEAVKDNANLDRPVDDDVVEAARNRLRDHGIEVMDLSEFSPSDLAVNSERGLGMTAVPYTVENVSMMHGIADAFDLLADEYPVFYRMMQDSQPRFAAGKFGRGQQHSGMAVIQPMTSQDRLTLALNMRGFGVVEALDVELKTGGGNTVSQRALVDWVKRSGGVESYNKAQGSRLLARAGMLHEVGHVLDFSTHGVALNDFKNALVWGWRNSETGKLYPANVWVAQHLSFYGAAHPKEAFAELVSAVLLDRKVDAAFESVADKIRRSGKG